jgi:hypothetical protein
METIFEKCDLSYLFDIIVKLLFIGYIVKREPLFGTGIVSNISQSFKYRTGN